MQRQCVLVFEDDVVHLPERPLRRGRLERLGGVLGVRMNLPERKVAVDEPESVTEQPLNLLHDGMRGGVEVAVFDERQWRVRSGDVKEWRKQEEKRFERARKEAEKQRRRRGKDDRKDRGGSPEHSL